MELGGMPDNGFPVSLPDPKLDPTSNTYGSMSNYGQPCEGLNPFDNGVTPTVDGRSEDWFEQLSGPLDNEEEAFEGEGLNPMGNEPVEDYGEVP